MKVFLSWSGDRSRRVAEALKEWLPDVLQALDPWVSSQDIVKGVRGSREIASELEGANFGIICVTAESQGSQWVNFEAGALSKQISDAYVVPFLIDLKISELKGPLAQFQATSSESVDDILKLLSDINTALGPSGVAKDRLERVFEKNWPELERKLSEIRKTVSVGSPVDSKRSQEDMLEEVLLIMRQQERRLVDIEGRLQQANMPTEYYESSPGSRGHEKREGRMLSDILEVAGLRFEKVTMERNSISVILRVDPGISMEEIRSLAKHINRRFNRAVTIKDHDGVEIVELPF